MVHWDLAALAIGKIEVFSNFFQGDVRTRATRAIQGRNLLRLRIVEQAEHVTTNARGARLGDIDSGRNSYRCILAFRELLNTMAVIDYVILPHFRLSSGSQFQLPRPVAGC